MARRNAPRRQFVWVRPAGTLNLTSPPNYAVDLLEEPRQRWGLAALRGATVQTIKGVVRVNAGADGVGVVNFRFGVRIGYAEDITGDAAEVREGGPFFQPSYGWMAMQQSMAVVNEYSPPGTSEPGSMHHFRTDSARKCEDMGHTLLAYFDAQLGNVPFDGGFADYDLSVGLKLP